MNLEGWILARLEPLAGAPLIILRDPQRMILPGALAVDGWAEQHGYTAPFCHGNLGLREICEPLLEKPDLRILLVDRSRESARQPLFYPDLAVRTGVSHRITVTLRDYLIDATGDRRWPQTINERRLSSLALKHVDGMLRAHAQLRDVDDTRFTDSDLQKIVMGAVLGINPFRKPSVSEVRRLCLQQHAGIGSLEGILSQDVATLLRGLVESAPRPFCHLLDRDPEWIIRAYALALILREHQLDHALLLPSLGPELYFYRDIDGEWLDTVLCEQADADPEQMLADVKSAETLLISEPHRLAMLARDQLHLDDPQAALEVLRRERLSELLRSLALLSLLADLLIHRKLALHRQAEALLAEQEQAAEVLPLRRPSESWEALVACYRRAIHVHALAARLAQTQRQLKVLPDDDLAIDLFVDIWTARGANRLDYYVSDVERRLRLGELMPVTSTVLWPELAARWDQAGRAFSETVDKGIQPWQQYVDTRFQDLVRRQYGEWIRQDNAPLVFTHQFLSRMLISHWDPHGGAKAVILVFDGLRTDAWEEIVRPVLEERFEVVESRHGCALLPTETQLSRKAIAAGCLPESFASTNEAALLARWLKENLGLQVHFDVLKDDDTVASGISIRYTSPAVDYVVFDFADNNLHHSNQELAFIYGNTVQDIMRQDVRSVLRDLPSDATVFVTSDHGFARSAPSYVAIPADALADSADCRYRYAQAQRNLRTEEPDTVLDLDARRMGLLGSPALPLGATFSHVLFPRPGYGFRRPHTGYNPDRYSHGGLTMAECLVPMVVLKHKQASQQVLVLADARQIGSRSEDEPLTIEIDVRPGAIGIQPIPITLSFSDPGLPGRREVVGASGGTYTVSWKPGLDDISAEERERGTRLLPLSITMSYQQHGQTVRLSRTIELQIKPDPTRIRRRMHSGLDLLMGKRP